MKYIAPDFFASVTTCQILQVSDNALRGCCLEGAMLDPKFVHAQEEYARLKARFDDGALTSDAFESALQNLIFEHEGRRWTIEYRVIEGHISEDKTRGQLDALLLETWPDDYGNRDRRHQRNARGRGPVSVGWRFTRFREPRGIGGSRQRDAGCERLTVDVGLRLHHSRLC